MTAGGDALRCTAGVNAIRWFRGEFQVVHLLNYNYDAGSGAVTVSVPRLELYALLIFR